MKRICIIIGTRPETIKMYPVIKEFTKRGNKPTVIFTGQHTDLAYQMLDAFRIRPDYSLNVMTENQELAGLADRLVVAIDDVLKKEKPEIVLVQGDTTSAFIGAVIAYYNRILVGHVEAGLRTGNIYNPFPEEGNRAMISRMASYNFAPTERAKENLWKENVKGEIIVTGNTGIDTLFEVLGNIKVEKKKQILVTLHRRESFGKPLKDILDGILGFIEDCLDWQVLFPVHPNPSIREVVYNKLQHPRIRLLNPLNYFQMVKAMAESSFIVTDSGGIIEEAPSLNRPVLIARDETERLEAIEAGTALLVGTKAEDIELEMADLALNKEHYDLMINKENPFGDGKAATRICEFLERL